MDAVLTQLEADAVRAAAVLPDDELGGRLADLVDLVAIDIDVDVGASELRELGAIALVTARRIDTDTRMGMQSGAVFPDADQAARWSELHLEPGEELEP